VNSVLTLVFVAQGSIWWHCAGGTHGTTALARPTCSQQSLWGVGPGLKPAGQYKVNAVYCASCLSLAELFSYW